MIFIAPTMRNLSKLTPIVFVFCLFFLLYHIKIVASSTPPRYVPVEDITLNCGSATTTSRRICMGVTGLGIFNPSSFLKKNLIISNLIPLVTTQRKTLATSALYLKRTSHNWISSYTHTHHTINQIKASQSPPLKSLTSSLELTLWGSVSESTRDYRPSSDTINNDLRKSANHICTIPQKD